MPSLKATLAALLIGAAAFIGTPVDAQQHYLSGYVCSLQVHKLCSLINWQTNLQQAEDLARQQGKLVFWVNMVGTMDGAT